jgi:uncharacterized metal-binding protein
VFKNTRGKRQNDGNFEFVSTLTIRCFLCVFKRNLAYKRFYMDLKIDPPKKRVAQNILRKNITVFCVSCKAHCLSGKHLRLFGHTKPFELKELCHDSSKLPLIHKKNYTLPN